MPAEKCYAVERSGQIYTLRRMSWPKGDFRRKWKWQAHVDGVHWRYFMTVGEWRAEIDVEYRPKPIGTYYQATMRAVTWSEHEGRAMLDALQSRNT